MNTNRRKFLTSTTALTASAAAGSMLRWGVESAEAQAMGGYKAIVCVFLFGGSDSNNMIIPFTDYAQYAATRTVASNVGITQAQLLPFTAPSAGQAVRLPSVVRAAGTDLHVRQARRDRQRRDAAPAADAGRVQSRGPAGRRTCSRTRTSRMPGWVSCPGRRWPRVGAVARRIRRASSRPARAR